MSNYKAQLSNTKDNDYLWKENAFPKHHAYSQRLFVS